MNKLTLDVCAKLCSIAYDDTDIALTKYKELGFDSKMLCQPMINEQVYALQRDTTCVIVLAGSNQIQDWIKNIFAIPGWYLHSGYSEVATGLMDSVEVEFKQSGCTNLLLLGHSKGGGIAAILGDYLSYLPVSIITFGAPRIASELYASTYLHDRYQRVVHPLDIVARVPLHSMGYRHCGQPVVYDGKDYDSSLKAWQLAQKKHPTIQLALTMVKSIQAHFSYWMN